MPSRYDQLISARAEAEGRVTAFRQVAMDLTSKMVTSLANYMGATSEQVQRLTGDDFEGMRSHHAPDSEVCGNGFALSNKGLLFAPAVLFGDGEWSSVLCAIRPQGDAFSVAVGTKEFTINRADEATFAPWCACVHDEFYDSAVSTTPFDFNE